MPRAHHEALLNPKIHLKIDPKSSPVTTKYGKIQNYLFLAVTSVGGQVWVKNLKKIPSFIAKNVHETPPPKRWGFFMFQCFFFFLIFAFFCLSFSSLPLLLDIFKPKNGPLNEVLGLFFGMFSAFGFGRGFFLCIVRRYFWTQRLGNNSLDS